MKLMWPKERIPEVPMNTYKPTTTTTRISIEVTSRWIMRDAPRVNTTTTASKMIRTAGGIAESKIRIADRDVAESLGTDFGPS